MPSLIILDLTYKQYEKKNNDIDYDFWVQTESENLS